MQRLHMLFILASLSATLPECAHAQTPGEALKACDAQASHPHDPLRRAPGVTDDQMVPLNAIEVCEIAASLNPQEPRTLFELARGYWLARRDADAFLYFWKAQKLGYAPAMKYIGDAYFYGRGLPTGQVRDPQAALDWYKKSGSGGFSDGLDMADEISKSPTQNRLGC